MRKIALFFAALCSSAFADELSDVESQIDRTRRRDSEISDRIRDNDRIVLQTKKELVGVANELSKLESEKASAENKIVVLEKKRAQLMKRIRENDANLADAAAGLIAVSMGGGAFDGGSADNYILTGAILTGVSEQFDREMKVALLQIGELEKLRSDLEKQQNIFAKAQNRHKKEQAELDGLLRKRYDQNRQLRSQQYELQRRLSGLSAKAKNLSDLANRVGPPADSPGGGPGEKARPAARARGVKMRFPVSGMLLLGFGDRGASGYRSDGWRVRANPNALVQAPADGKIEFADSFRGFGRIAIVNHNDGYYSVLTGMESLNVFVGQDVLAGEPIGKMPDKNPEMYLELRRGSKAVDPAVMFMYPR